MFGHYVYAGIDRVKLVRIDDDYGTLIFIFSRFHRKNFIDITDHDQNVSRSDYSQVI